MDESPARIASTLVAIGTRMKAHSTHPPLLLLWEASPALGGSPYPCELPDLATMFLL